MKKLMTLALMSLLTMAAGAQNIQLHYDFGRNIYTGEEAGRQKVTITLEQFKADKWGSCNHGMTSELDLAGCFGVFHNNK